MYAFAAVLSLLSFLQCFGSFAQTSPEPEPVEEGLYLYSAGTHGSYLFPLANGISICPDDFPLGFNVLCKGESTRAKFFVNSVPTRTEHKVPFFLAGDTKKKIRAWSNYPESALIRCVLFKPKRNLRAHVWFKCWFFKCAYLRFRDSMLFQSLILSTI